MKLVLQHAYFPVYILGSFDKFLELKDGEELELENESELEDESESAPF